MKLLGLTGGIGMGKSAAAGMLRERDIPVVDTDVLARELVEPGQPALAEIRRAFGPEMAGPDGHLRRDLLAKRVFGDDAARRQLEEILHPRIRSEWKLRTDTWRSQGEAAAVVVIPLLFETQAQSEFDSIICLACSAATQNLRLADRGWSKLEIEQRVAAQLPIEQKIARSDFVVWTEGGFDILSRQLDMVLSRL